MFPSIYYPQYTRSATHWFLFDVPAHQNYSRADEKVLHGSMLFHVSAGDYIATLATILRFFQETLQNNDITSEMRELQLKTVRGVISDLLYLNKHYKIVPKRTVTDERLD